MVTDTILKSNLQDKQIKEFFFLKYKKNKPRVDVNIRISYFIIPALNEENKIAVSFK